MRTEHQHGRVAQHWLTLAAESLASSRMPVPSLGPAPHASPLDTVDAVSQGAGVLEEVSDCPTCDGERRVRIGSGHNDREVDCPDCTEAVEDVHGRVLWREVVRS